MGYQRREDSAKRAVEQGVASGCDRSFGQSCEGRQTDGCVH